MFTMPAVIQAGCRQTFLHLSIHCCLLPKTGDGKKRQGKKARTRMKRMATYRGRDYHRNLAGPI